MSDQPSSDSPLTPPPTPPSQRKSLSSDEFVAVLVAFGAIGSILWWGLRQSGVANFATGQGLDTPPVALGSSGTGDLDLFSSSNAPSQSRVTAALPSVSGPSVTTEATGDSPWLGAAPFAGAATVGAVAATQLPAASSPAAVAVPLPSPSIAAAVLPAVTPSVAVAPPVLVVPSVQTSSAFSDVPNSYWAYPFIKALGDRGIVTADANGQFQPDRPITRAEYAAFIQNIFEQPADRTPITFKDVSPEVAPAIDKAVKIGFLKGYPGDVFNPDQVISRMQVLLSLNNGLRMTQPQPPAEVVKVFSDASQIPAWALPAIASATSAKMVVSYPDSAVFNPNQPATRAEVVAMIHQALVAAGKLQPVTSEYIVAP